MCVTVCPHNVFIMKNRKANPVNRDACMECGACQMNCSFGALSVKAGVGCAAAILYSQIRGIAEPQCGCSADCCG